MSTDSYNRFSYLKQVVPVTSTHHDYPMNVQIPEGTEPIHGDILVNQVRSVDLNFRNYQRIGRLSNIRMIQVMNLLKLLYGFK